MPLVKPLPKTSMPATILQPKPFKQATPSPETRAPWKQWKLMTCPSCLEEYELGKSGTIAGCDRCEGISRDANGMIIPDPFAEVFIEGVEDGDTQS